MSAAHTPGPWWVQQSDHADVGLLIKPIPGQVVAECDPVPEMEANARLIAAAPELLAIVFDLLDYAENATLENDDEPPVFRAARAAIAKATGGQP